MLNDTVDEYVVIGRLFLALADTCEQSDTGYALSRFDGINLEHTEGGIAGMLVGYLYAFC